VFHALASWGRGMSKEEYATAGKAGCADYPFESFDRD
jgi:hypothetical protein